MRTVVRNDGVRLPVERSGAGRPVVFLNGGGATTVSWRRTVAALGDGYESITFDWRGHGRASAARHYRFGDFVEDADAVMTSLAVRRPVLVGWSLGADVALEHALTHPGQVSGLVLVDGALPLHDGLIRDAAAMRRTLTSPAYRGVRAAMRVTPYRWAVPLDAYADLVVELDARRLGLEERGAYRELDCPASLLLSTSPGHGKDAQAQHVARAWRDSGERLAAGNPRVAITWIEGSHNLPFTSAAQIAAAITAMP